MGLALTVTKPCGCPASVKTWLTGIGGGQCESCGSRWDREDVVYDLRQGAENKPTYARLRLERLQYDYEQAQRQLAGLQQYIERLAPELDAARAAVAQYDQPDPEETR